VHAFLALVRPDDLFLRAYRGLYCPGCEDFFLERDLDAQGGCPDHGQTLVEIEEENVFFRLSRYQAEIAALIRSDRLRITPESRRTEVLRFIEQGLQDISVSRDAARAGGWGIPFPELPALKESRTLASPAAQVVYVWIDALVNYLTGLGFPDGDWSTFWGHDTRRIHLIGKNVWKFHAVYWPALLLSAGLPLPDEIVVHGFLTENGRKISKSTGNAVDPVAYVDRYGADAVRYFLLRYVRPFEDSDFTEERLAAVYRSDLSNGLGNLASRLTTLCERFAVGAGDSTEAASDPRHLTDYRFDRALDELWKEVDALNREIAEARPWDSGDSAESVAATRAQLGGWAVRLRRFAVGLRPFLAKSADRLECALTASAIKKAAPLFPRRG
jgi:methionyl-tRNA synthetase